MGAAHGSRVRASTDGVRSECCLIRCDAVGKARKIDYVIVDTAGRLHTKANLMAELEKMRRTAQRVIPEAPHEVLLVIEATTGQNGLEQARKFTETAEVTGIILTKLDGTASGGVVVAISRELGVPIRYVGVGEQIDDLLPFEPETFCSVTILISMSQYPRGSIESRRAGRGSNVAEPAVGAVVVADGQVVGRGFHGRACATLRVTRWKKRARRAKGATIYTTLEPCSHTGRTGACADAIIGGGHPEGCIGDGRSESQGARPRV